MSPEVDYQIEAINAAVSKQLPAYLEKVLPNVLESLLAGGPKSHVSSPASSFTSVDCLGNKYPKLPPLTPLGKTWIPHLRVHLAQQFQQYQARQLQHFEQLVDKKLDEVWNEAYDARAHETAEMMNEMEEHKADIALLKEDTIKDLGREVEDVFTRCKEGDVLSNDVNEWLSEFCDRIYDVKELKLQKMIAREFSKQKRKKMGVLKRTGKRSRRSDKRLLGRRREEEEEWVDC